MTARHERIAQMQERLAKELGEAKPLSFARIAEPAGVTPAGLSKVSRLSRAGVESGDKILRMVADHWGYSVDWLLGGRGDPQQKELPALDRALASFDWEPEAVAAAKSRQRLGKSGDWSEERWNTYLRQMHSVAQQAETASLSAAPDMRPTEALKVKR